MSEKPRVLEVDLGRPGGWAVVEGERLVATGPLLKEIENDALIVALRAILLGEWTKGVRPERVATERVGVWGKRRVAARQREMLGLVEAAIGFALRAGAECEKQVVLVSPSTLRVATCGTGRATKRQVGEVLRRTYPLLRRKDVTEHMLDAVAIALCAGRRTAVRGEK